jgi:hypothetical protein
MKMMICKELLEVNGEENLEILEKKEVQIDFETSSEISEHTAETSMQLNGRM